MIRRYVSISLEIGDKIPPFMSGVVIVLSVFLTSACEQNSSMAPDRNAFDLRLNEMKSLVAQSDSRFEEVFNDLLLESAKFPDSLEYVRTLLVGSGYYLKIGKGQSSLNLLDKALPVAEKKGFSKHLRYITMQYGMTYLFMGSYDLAIEYILESMRYREIEGDPEELGVAYNNIGLAYYKLRENQLALEYFRKTAAILEYFGDSEVAYAYANIGLTFSEMKKYDSAWGYYERGRQISESSRLQNPRQFELVVSFAEGKTLSDLRKYDLAIELLSSSFEIAKEQSDLRFQAESQLHLARVYTSVNKLGMANAALDEALAVSIGAGLKEVLLNVYREKALVAGKLHNLDNEVFFQERYIDLAHELYHDHLYNKIGAVKTAFENRQNQSLLAEQKATLAAYEEMIRNRSSLIVLVIGAIILILVIIVFIAWSKNRRGQWNQELDRKVFQQTRTLEEKYNASLRYEAELNITAADLRRRIRERLATFEGLFNLKMLQRGADTGSADLKMFSEEIIRLRELIDRSEID